MGDQRVRFRRALVLAHRGAAGPRLDVGEAAQSKLRLCLVGVELRGGHSSSLRQAVDGLAPAAARALPCDGSPRRRPGPGHVTARPGDSLGPAR